MMAKARAAAGRLKRVVSAPPDPVAVARSKAAIGEGTWFADAPWIAGRGEVTIGRWCAIGRGLTVISQNHDTRFANMHVPLQQALGLGEHLVPAPVAIGDAAWIGDSVTILPGASIGTGAVVGARSVVTGAVPAFSVAVGAPCRVIRPRFTSDVVEALLEVAWWCWPVDKMLANVALFELDLTTAAGDEVRAAAGS